MLTGSTSENFQSNQKTRLKRIHENEDKNSGPYKWPKIALAKEVKQIKKWEEERSRKASRRTKEPSIEIQQKMGFNL